VNLGVIAGYRGESSAGRANLERAVRILEAHATTEQVALASALSALANIEFNEGRGEQAIAGFRRALELYRSRGVEDAQLLAIMGNLAGALGAAGQFDEAKPLLREVLDATERQFGKQAATLVPPLRLLAINSYQRGSMDEELAHYERALAVARAAYPKDHPWVADTLAETGWCLSRAGKHAEGEQRLRDALSMYERLGNKGQLPAATWRQMGLSQERRNEGVVALASLDKGWNLCKGASFESGKPCLLVRATRARLLALNGQGDEAMQEADATLAAIAQRKRKGPDERAQALEARAAALQALGRLDEAAVTQREALQGYASMYGLKHEMSVRAQQALAALEAKARR
jgi:tetratricopeptide (TPR) repeat protein